MRESYLRGVYSVQSSGWLNSFNAASLTNLASAVDSCRGESNLVSAVDSRQVLAS